MIKILIDAGMDLFLKVLPAAVSLNLDSSVGAKKMCKILKCIGNLKNA